MLSSPVPYPPASLPGRILTKIKGSIDKSGLGSLLFNARSQLGTNFNLLSYARKQPLEPLEQDTELSARRERNRLISSVKDSELNIIAILILLRLYDDPVLSNIKVETGGRSVKLKDSHPDYPIIKDSNFMSVSIRRRLPIETSFDRSKADPTKIEKIIIKWPDELDEPMEITPKEPINIEQLEKDVLKMISKQPSST